MNLPKTVRVRILVGVDEQARWIASGFNLLRQQSRPHIDANKLGASITYHWVEAEVPYVASLPTAVRVVPDAA